MSTEWKYPENTESVLYISDAFAAISFGEMFSKIQDHFGEYTPLSKLRIEYVRWTYEEPCSCCRGSGEFGDYYRIELVDAYDEQTSDIDVRKLVKE